MLVPVLAMGIASGLLGALIVVLWSREKPANVELVERTDPTVELSKALLAFVESEQQRQAAQMTAVLAQAQAFGEQAANVLHTIVRGWAPTEVPVGIQPDLPATGGSGLPTQLDDLDDDWRDPSLDFYPPVERRRAVIEHVQGGDLINLMRSGQ